ncbi:MAG: hypothetical protein WED33_06615 [Bacteroidia bacterium]
MRKKLFRISYIQQKSHLFSVYLVSMKSVIILFLIFSCHFASSQDTTKLYKQRDGAMVFWLNRANDTIIKSVYPNKKTESIKHVKNGMISGEYKRWYENGKIMWKKEMSNSEENGNVQYFDLKGEKIAEYGYADGEISDTFFIKSGIRLIIGEIAYSSEVHGGMQHEDGSSNVSRNVGPYKYIKMYAALVDSLKKPRFIGNFKTDDQGKFIVLAPKGEIGFFPESNKIEDLNTGQYYPIMEAWNSGQSGWDKITIPNITKDGIYPVKLHHFSVGYAP